jgi:hypothetical protein
MSSNARLIDRRFPHTAAWIREYGWIEVGPTEHSPSLVRAFEGTGLVWEGAEEYDSLDAALEALEAGLAAWRHLMES